MQAGLSEVQMIVGMRLRVLPQLSPAESLPNGHGARAGSGLPGAISATIIPPSNEEID
jgi:hypothetical protein